MGAAEDIENGWFSMKENDFIFWQIILYIGNATFYRTSQ